MRKMTKYNFACPLVGKLNKDCSLIERLVKLDAELKAYSLGWIPIAITPSHGREVLLADFRFEILASGCGAGYTLGWYNSMHGQWIKGTGSNIVPTHWLEIPPICDNIVYKECKND
jgi:hypothetical protein